MKSSIKRKPKSLEIYKKLIHETQALIIAKDKHIKALSKKVESLRQTLRGSKETPLDDYTLYKLKDSGITLNVNDKDSLKKMLEALL